MKLEFTREEAQVLQQVASVELSRRWSNERAQDDLRRACRKLQDALGMRDRFTGAIDDGGRRGIES